MRALSGDHTPGEYTSLWNVRRVRRPLAKSSVQRSPGTPYGESFTTPRLPSGDNTTLAVRSWRSERAQGLSLPVKPGELEGSRSRCGPIGENAVARHRKHSGGVPRDLDVLGHGHRHALELQAASVEWLCHQRARARKKYAAIRVHRWHTAGQYPLTRLVPGVDIKRTNVHALNVRRSGAEIQKVFAVGEERGPRVIELSLGYVDLRHRPGRATCLGHSPQRTARSAAPTPQHDVAIPIPGALTRSRCWERLATVSGGPPVVSTFLTLLST